MTEAKERRIKAKIHALMFAWGWLTYFSEGLEQGELSDNLENDLMDGYIPDEDFGTLVQKMANHEADIIHRKMWKLRRKLE